MCCPNSALEILPSRSASKMSVTAAHMAALCMGSSTTRGCQLWRWLQLNRCRKKGATVFELVHLSVHNRLVYRGRSHSFAVHRILDISDCCRQTLVKLQAGEARLVLPATRQYADRTVQTMGILPPTEHLRKKHQSVVFARACSPEIFCQMTLLLQTQADLPWRCKLAQP